MKKNILLLSYLPIVIVFTISVVFFVFLYFAFEDNIDQELKITQEKVINLEKRYLKKSVKDFKQTFYLFKTSIYERTQDDLAEFLKYLIKHGKLNELKLNGEDIIAGEVPKNEKFQYLIENNKFVILKHGECEYLVYFTNIGKKVYLAGINKKIIDSFVLEKIISYLDKINKNNPSYIALGKILTFTPDKNGNFGYLFYMPPNLKSKEGMILSVNKPDVKGNYFREEYFNCLKKGKSCFVSYYFENPKTGKVEKKVSYYSLLHEYNLSILKGIYESQIKQELKNKIDYVVRQFKNFFILSIVIYILVFIIFMFFFVPFINRTKSDLIKEYEGLISKLKNQYYYDELTHLPNRNKLFEDMKKFKGLIVFDIDNFSTINEIYGFEFGNEILKKVKEKFRAYKYFYRVGSDEFAIGYPHQINGFELKNVLNMSFEYNNIDINYEIGGSNIKERLFQTAEMAMKMAKKNKLKYLLYDEKIEKSQKEKFNKIQSLHHALKEKKVFPYYQCIVDKDGKICKYEALMRVEVDGKIISPFAFMDLIKEANIYHDFSKIMIEKVFEDSKKIDVPVSINLSFEDIVNGEINELIFSLLEKQGGENIVFEVLESESIKNFDMVKEFIVKVKSYNAQIAIDDFGSGYSNFVNILDLNPDIIKIDASIIKNLNNEKYRKIVELIVEFAKNFNIKTVAEFVSDEEKFLILSYLGIDEYQGFYFCEPIELSL
ncbi:EAL domain-containing protein [Caminibacter pacificus]